METYIGAMQLLLMVTPRIVEEIVHGGVFRVVAGKVIAAEIAIRDQEVESLNVLQKGILHLKNRP